MKIHLKQKEIEAALRGYIAKQGITLAGRTLEIDFTSGRSGNGLTADISIEDAGIPGFEADTQEEPEAAAAEDDAANQPTPAAKTTTKPTLKAVDNGDVVVPIREESAQELNEPALTFGDPVQSPAVKEPVKTGVSLFN